MSVAWFNQGGSTEMMKMAVIIDFEEAVNGFIDRLDVP